MPELPDVENFKRYLDATALHKKIEKVKVGSHKILHGISGPRLAKTLAGHALESTHRHGKHLFAGLDNGDWLALHFGMTGHLAYFKDLADDPKHDRLRLDFANGYHLAFVNQRLFGSVELTGDPGTFVEAAGLGPDALDDSLDEGAFRELFAGRRGQVKSALMDQSLMAGIGNVYSDEILFQAGIHPKTRIDNINPKEISKLYRTMRRVLEKAIDCGAGSEELLERLPRSYLLIRREDGAKCPRCGGTIKKIKSAGRTGYYCPACQPAPHDT